MSSATSKQRFRLWLDTGKCLNIKDMTLSFEKAGEMINRIATGQNTPEEVHDMLINLGAEEKHPFEAPKPKMDWAAIYEEAHNAGHEAALNIVPTPMTVVERSNPLDDTSPVIKQYAPVMDGICGFAYITFPGNSSWARWAKNQGIAKKSYNGGYQIWVSGYNQSMTRKYAYAQAFAKVLTKYGVTRVYAQQRAD